MHISVVGMGYVGCVTAGCLASQGHIIAGVESNPMKHDQLTGGHCPVAEAGLSELIETAIKKQQLYMASSLESAVADTEMTIICVGTPSQYNGDLDRGYIVNVCEKIGAALKTKNDFHIVVVRSTVLPGTIKSIVVALLEKHSGKKSGVDFGVCNNPEFMREGTAVHDYFHPPKIVIGETDKHSGDAVQSLYKTIDAPVIRCPIETAEMVKYADNAWHAVKISFANEIGKLCKVSGIDSHQVMDIFCKDTKLNLSPYYLKPGFAFGGSCLPKDVRALNFMAQSLDIQTPLLSSVLLANQAQIEWGLELIKAQEKNKIGFLGICFKAGTDDIRESPIIMIMQNLADSGYQVFYYEPQFTAADEYDFGSCKKTESIDALIHCCDVIVIGNNAPEFAAISDKLDTRHIVIDFVRIAAVEANHPNYHGICW